MISGWGDASGKNSPTTSLPASRAINVSGLTSVFSRYLPVFLATYLLLFVLYLPVFLGTYLLFICIVVFVSFIFSNEFFNRPLFFLPSSRYPNFSIFLSLHIRSSLLLLRLPCAYAFQVVWTLRRHALIVASGKFVGSSFADLSVSFVCMFVCLFICLFIYLFIYLFIHLFIYLLFKPQLMPVN